MNEQVSLQRFITSLKKLWWLLLVCPSIMVTLVFGINHYLTKPEYTSTAQLLVTVSTAEQQVSQTADGVRTALQMASTYSTTLTSARTLQQVLDENNYDIPISALKREIETKNNTNSLIFSISVTDSNAVRAKKIVEDIVRINQRDFPKMFSNTQIVVLENASSAAIHNQIIRYLLAVFLGMGLAILGILLQMQHDKIIRDRDGIESLGIVFLGDIPEVKGE